jgi:cytochrome o ubiquinol oxidase subunit I
VLGFLGMTRRLNHYDNPAWHPWLLLAEGGAVLIAIGIVFQIAQLYVSIRDRDLPGNRDTTGDPWGGRTLEWAISSPPPAYNFAVIPHVSELDAYANMKAAGLETIDVARVKYADIHMPSNTSAGFVISIFSLVLGFAAVWHIWWLVVTGLVGIVITTIAYSFSKNEGHYVPAAMVKSDEEARNRSLAELLKNGQRRRTLEDTVGAK